MVSFRRVRMNKTLSDLPSSTFQYQPIQLEKYRIHLKPSPITRQQLKKLLNKLKLKRNQNQKQQLNQLKMKLRVILMIS